MTGTESTQIRTEGVVVPGLSLACHTEVTASALHTTCIRRTLLCSLLFFLLLFSHNLLLLEFYYTLASWCKEARRYLKSSFLSAGSNSGL